MTPRFTISNNQPDLNGWAIGITDHETNEPFNSTTYEVHSESITDTKEELEDLTQLLNALHEENQRLKEEIDGLKVTLQARDVLISICEKKFRELGYIITVDDDGYVIE